MKLTRLHNAALALALGALVACGSGTGGVGTNASGGTVTAQTGAAMVTLTDAPGDFLSYLVNVTSVQLKRADGTVVETLPATTQVDFAQLVNLSEVLSAKQVPAGTYTSVSLTLDYATASIVVDNSPGASITVPAANILNGGNSNSPLTSPNSQVTLTLQLPVGKPLVVNQGTVANLALDFNLSASNLVVLAGGSATVTVNPVLQASITPDATKSLRLRGPLVAVTNTSADMSYSIHVRPFFRGEGEHGDLVVKTTSATTFTLNGTPYTGTAGLTALAALPVGTLTAASGLFDVATKTFTAASVLAGTSIPGAGLDSIGGTVIARSGNVLTIANGQICERSGGRVSFVRQTTVTLGSATTVTKDGSAATFATSDISVGQHVQLFGTLATDGSGNKTLDATAGSARLVTTPLWGRYTSVASGVVTLNLQQLDGRPVTAFNFAGTGSSLATDAVAASYTVNVPSALSIGTPTAGTTLRFYGFVAPFGAAPPNFNAVSLVNYALTTSKLSLEWDSPGVTAPFVGTLSPTNVVINQATVQTAEDHTVSIGLDRTDLSTVTAGITLVPNAAATSTGFAIAHRTSRTINSYDTFDLAIAALNTALNGTTRVREIEADGSYNATTSTLSVNHLIVVLND